MLSYRWRGVRGLRAMPFALPAPQSRRPVAPARAGLRKGLGFSFSGQCLKCLLLQLYGAEAELRGCCEGFRLGMR